MKIDYLKSLNGVERMITFVYYFENRGKYSNQEREKLDHYFEGF